MKEEQNSRSWPDVRPLPGRFRKGSLIPITITFLFLTLLTDTVLYGGDRKPVKPSPKDKCPVCGMFVAKYPDWMMQILFKDGSYAVFDGAKDMFKYYLNLEKYAKGKRASDIDSIYVTDYYSLSPIDGFKAVYVIGSNVYGPMGHELIPFQKKADAEEFMVDHSGKSVLGFTDVKPDVIKGLD
jgi:nitrous oxide reductase accessory protein NosL